MKENSRKDIQKVDKLIKKCDECKLNECINCEISWTEVVSIKKITDEYKKVLKMNEVLLKENEELKSDNLEYQRIQDIFDKRTYRKKYLEERRKEELNLLYPDADEIYRRYYELKKENETLEELLQGNLYEMYKYYKNLANSYQGNCISKEKIKKVIKEKEWALENYNCDESDYKQSQAIGAWDILQKLLKESEDKL